MNGSCFTNLGLSKNATCGNVSLNLGTIAGFGSTKLHTPILNKDDSISTA